MLTAKRVRDLLNYDPATGIFTWRVTRTGYASVGSTAGSMQKSGYFRIKIDGKPQYLHRLAWLHVHGSWPENYIDHINGITADNRIRNLREASKAENLRNRPALSSNTSGKKGVSWHKGSSKWQSRISIDGRRVHLGYYAAVDDAYAAYWKAAQELHGEFANAG